MMTKQNSRNAVAGWRLYKHGGSEVIWLGSMVILKEMKRVLKCGLVEA